MDFDLYRPEQDSLQILLKRVGAPFVFLRHWTENDYRKPVALPFDDHRVHFYYSPPLTPEFNILEKRLPTMTGDFLISIPRRSRLWPGRRKTVTEASIRNLAPRIYKIYTTCLERLVVSERWVARLPVINASTITDYKEMFEVGKGLLRPEHVFWRTGNNTFRPLRQGPKIPKARLNPLFRSSRLLTPAKWDKLGRFAASSSSLDKNVEELLRIRSRAEWGEKRIAIVETAALMEAIMRTYVQETLRKRGLTSQDVIEDEAGLFLLLNALLPLAMSKSAFARIRLPIRKLDGLRRIRNRVLHHNLPEDRIESRQVIDGVNAAIRLTIFLGRLAAQRAARTSKA